MASIKKPPKSPEVVFQANPEHLVRTAPDDPIKRLAADLQAHVDDLARLREDIRSEFSKVGDRGAEQLVWHLPGAIDRVLRIRLYWQAATLHGLVLALMFIAGVAVGYLIPRP